MEALETARNNAKKLNLNINLVQANWLESFSKRKFNLIISNPHYMNSADKRLTADGLKFEPKVALVGGQDGFECYRQISALVNLILQKNSFLFIEIGKSQITDIKKIFLNQKLKLIKIVKDYQQIERILVLKKVENSKI